MTDPLSDSQESPMDRSAQIDFVLDAAVLRELDEETGLTADQVLGLHRLGGPRPTYCVGHGREEIFLVYLAFTELADDDVICGEGRQMVFVAPADLASRKLNDHTRACLPELVAAIAAQRS